MQQLSGSSGRGGTQTPATNVLLRWMSDLRSRGDDNREENIIAGLESLVEPFAELVVVVVVGREREEAVVGGLLLILGVGASRREA